MLIGSQPCEIALTALALALATALAAALRNDAIFFCGKGAGACTRSCDGGRRNYGGGAGGGEPVRASAVMEGRGISGRFLSTADFLTF